MSFTSIPSGSPWSFSTASRPPVTFSKRGAQTIATGRGSLSSKCWPSPPHTLLLHRKLLCTNCPPPSSMGWGRTISFMRFGPSWKVHRKEVQGYLRNHHRWERLQTREARRTALSVLAAPERFRSAVMRYELVRHGSAELLTLINRFTVAISLKVSYGVDVHTEDNRYNQIARDAIRAIGNGGMPANSIVDVFPLGE
jgi:hypothetical protein